MAHDEHTKSNAEAQQKETRFILGMIRIGIHLGIFVIERSLSLLEGHAVSALIGPALLLVPGKSEFVHMYIVCITRPTVNTQTPPGKIIVLSGSCARGSAGLTALCISPPSCRLTVQSGIWLSGFSMHLPAMSWHRKTRQAVSIAAIRDTAASPARSYCRPVAALNLTAPPTTGSCSRLSSRLTVSSVPGFGHRVKSRSLEKTIRPMRLPAGMI